MDGTAYALIQCINMFWILRKTHTFRTMKVSMNTCMELVRLSTSNKVKDPAINYTKKMFFVLSFC